MLVRFVIYDEDGGKWVYDYDITAEDPVHGSGRYEHFKDGFSQMAETVEFKSLRDLFRHMLSNKEIREPDEVFVYK